MIHEIVSSDVDFARGMMDSGHSDTEILAYLASRSLDPAKAAQLVDDLRHGRKPSVPLPFEFHPAGQGAAGKREAATAAAHQVEQEQHSHRKRSGSGTHRSSGIPWWFVILLGGALLALGYVLLETGTDASKSAIDIDKHSIPAAPGKDAGR